MSDDACPLYVLICRECSPELPIPFPTPAERGRWAAAHTAGAGHDTWLVIDIAPGPGTEACRRPAG